MLNKNQFKRLLSHRFANRAIDENEMDRMHRQYLWEQRMMEIQTVAVTAPIGSGPQFPGDYRSRTSGDWNDPATWERQEGAFWVPAKTPPGSINNVYIQIGDFVSMSADGSCRDLNLNSNITVEPRRLHTNNHLLKIYGKMRTYAGAKNVIPGTNSTGVNNSPVFLNGRLQIVGEARKITFQGEWGVPQLLYGFDVDFSMDPGATGTIDSNFRASNVTISPGGPVEITGGSVRLGDPSTGSGSFTIKSGGTFVTARFGFFRGSIAAPQAFGKFEVERGGTLVIPTTFGNEGLLAANTVIMDGDVIVNFGLLPFFQNGGAVGAANPCSQIYNLTLNAESTMTQNMQFNGTLTLNAIINSSSSFKPTIGPSGSIAGATGNRYINGPLDIISTSTQKSLAFEIGKKPNFRRAVLQVTQDSSTSTTYRAEVFNTGATSRTLPPTLTNVSGVRYWNLSKGAGASVTAAQISLDYGVADGVTAGSKIALASGSNWLDIGGTGAIGTTGTITSTSNFTTFGDFALANVSS